MVSSLALSNLSLSSPCRKHSRLESTFHSFNKLNTFFFFLNLDTTFVLNYVLFSENIVSVLILCFFYSHIPFISAHGNHMSRRNEQQHEVSNHSHLVSKVFVHNCGLTLHIC